MGDDLRHRYASALDDLDYGHDQQERRYVFVDDALEVVMAVRDEELERLRGIIDRHDHGIMPVCEGYMASRAEQAERERDEWHQRVEQARAVCYKAMAEKDAPGMWLVAQQVLAVLDNTTAEETETRG